jgi:hypothetical protein
MWTQNVSLERLHYLRSLFASPLGYVHFSSFIKASESFYNLKQYAVNGDSFITWAYLSPDMEINYLSGKFDWLDSMAHGELWLTEASISDGIPFAKTSLKHLSNRKYANFISKGKFRKIRLI